MEGWLQRAPLLHGTQPPERPATDPGSSASIPREVVQEEVRRQAQEALGGQQRRMEELRRKSSPSWGTGGPWSNGHSGRARWTRSSGAVRLCLMEYQKGIKPVFMRVLKNPGGIGLAVSLWGMEYHKGNQEGVRESPE